MSKYDEKERSWRKEYNQRPEVKARQRLHVKKYMNKKEVRDRVREYQRDYMKNYWSEHPDKYVEHKERARKLSRIREQKEHAERELQNKILSQENESR